MGLVFRIGDISRSPITHGSGDEDDLAAEAEADLVMPSHVEKAAAWIHPFYDQQGSPVLMRSGKLNTEKKLPSVTAR
jgi:hypothetical protein